MDIHRIKSLAEDGLSTYEIAALVGVSQSVIYRTCRANDIKTVKRTGPRPNNPRLESCLSCGQPINGCGKKFCTKECATTGRRAARTNRWLNGLESGTDRSGGMHAFIRRWLLTEADNKCSLCGWGKTNPYSNKVTLTIDHIDGDSMNNRRDNLIVLCYNCHTLTPTFNQLNRGNGRRYMTPGRRQRNNGRLTQSG